MMLAWAVAAAAAPLVTWDFTAADQGLVATGDTLQWAWSPSPAGGPGGASWSTNPDGQYLHDADDQLELVLPSLTGLSSPTLLLRHGYDVVGGDQAVVEIDVGAGWQLLEPSGAIQRPMGSSGTPLAGWMMRST